ncbi:MAG TPA: hypothetical protein VES40_08575 [Ilumatobacteraceae bacterium]|nr:hypothetical protein [Ilumatobacteraceae bacterium]
MHDPMLLFTGMVAALVATINGVVGNGVVGQPAPDLDRDRGAVSIEQVLWYAAAAISVAVVAAIIWNQIRDTANTPVQSPSAP